MSDPYQSTGMGMSDGRKTITLGEMYGSVQFRRAMVIYNSLKDDNTVLKDTLRDEIVKPALAYINKITEQENDPDFLAYQLIHVFNSLEK